MSTLRATFVALVALSVALLPVAGVVAQPSPSEGSHLSAQTECCPHEQPCETHANSSHAKIDHAKGHCGSHDGCGGNCLCLGLTAVLLPALAESFAPVPALKIVRVAESAASPAYMPPAPPPRA